MGAGMYFIYCCKLLSLGSNTYDHMYNILKKIYTVLLLV